jgi:hypothetical protein
VWSKFVVLIFFFFFYILIYIFFFLFVVAHGCGVALAQSIFGLTLGPALNVTLSMGALCVFFFIIWGP